MAPGLCGESYTKTKKAGTPTLAQIRLIVPFFAMWQLAGAVFGRILPTPGTSRVGYPGRLQIDVRRGPWLAKSERGRPVGCQGRL